MKQISTYFTLSLLILTFGVFELQAQNVRDPHVLRFKSGEIRTVPNAAAFAKDTKAYEHSLFKNYYHLIVQFETLPDAQDRKSMHAEGIELNDYLPENAYYARVRKDISPDVLTRYKVRSLLPVSETQKTSKMLAAKPFPKWSEDPSGFGTQLRIVLFGDYTFDDVREELITLGLQRPAYRGQVYDVLSFSLETSKIPELIKKPWVVYADIDGRPAEDRNDVARGSHRADAVFSPSTYGLSGEGVTIGEWDGGEVGPHVDFTGRLTLKESSGPNGHATHVGGTAAGAGILEPYGMGMAPKATLYSWNYTSGGSNAEMNAAMADPADRFEVTTHSWGNGFFGCPTPGEYDTDARFIDELINDYPYLSVLWAIGNTQGSGCVGDFRSITSGWEISKNSIGVGALTSNETETGYSSYGPVEDGRIKPDIVGLGSSIYSTLPNNAYGNNTGTSMSTPGVSGTIALLYEYYRDNIGGGTTYPNSQLVKAVVLNNGEDLGNTGPDYKYGYGRINAYKSVKTFEDSRYLEDNVAAGVTNTHNIVVPAGVEQVNVMLCWMDPEAAVGALPALINDLDLEVTGPGPVTYEPWILDPASPGNPATTGTDNLNPMEQVTINTPVAGTYTISVTGSTVPMGPQTYALTWNIDEPHINVTYPIGGESLEPSTNYVVTWDAAGLTGTQTVEYSTNGGATWTNIATGLAASVRKVNWNTPNVMTNQALVRVTDGTETDQSDAFFNIMGRAGGLSTTAACGSATLNWSAVAGADEYDVYYLNLTTGEFVFHGTAVGVTTYSVTGLAPGTNWLTIRARDTGTGALSMQADAVSVDIVSATDDLRITGITSPTCDFAVPSSENVTIVIENNGCAAFPAGTNIPVSYTFGGSTVSETFTLGAALGVGASTNYTFTATLNITVAGSYSLDAEVSYPTDGNASNNTMSHAFASAAGLPYYEDFENPSPAPCWTRTQDAGSFGFVYGTALGSASYAIPAGSQYAASNDDDCDCDMDNDFLISPRFDFTGGTGVQLTFDAVYPSADFDSDGFVKVSTVSAAGPWTTVYTFDADAVAGPTVNTGINNTWQAITVDLSAYDGSPQVWIAFHHDDNGSWASGLAVDNFKLCGSPAPTAASFSPADNATGVSPDTDIILTFDQPIQEGTGNVTITDGVTPIVLPVSDPQVTISGNQIIIDLTASLAPLTTYDVILDAGAVENVCGLPFTGVASGDWTFITGTVGLDDDSEADDPAVQVTSGPVSSLATTLAAAVDVFKFNITDQGTSDGLATDVTTVVIKKGALNTVADWSSQIQGAELSVGGTAIPAAVSINPNDLTFTIAAGSFTVADGTSEEVLLKIFLNTSGIDDEAAFQFEIPNTGHDFTSTTAGSLFATDFGTPVTSNVMTIDVAATEFSYVTIPGTVTISTDFSVTVAAVDANGNIDKAPRTITLSLNSGPGTLSSGAAIASVAMIDGQYTFTLLNLDALGIHTLLTADGVIPDEVSSDIDVVDVTTPPVVTPPDVNAPAFITAVGLDTETVELKWFDSSTEEDGYRIYRIEENSGFAANIATVGAGDGGEMIYIDNFELKPDTRYTYYVEAYRTTYVASSDRATDFTYPEVPEASIVNACAGGAGGIISATGTHQSDKFYWYESMSTETAVTQNDGSFFTASEFMTPTINSATTYYLTAKGQKYESTPRLAVTVDVEALPTAELLAAATEYVCDDSYMLEATAVEGASYEWYRFGRLIGTTTEPSFEVTQNGDYTVQVIRDRCDAVSGSTKLIIGYEPQAAIMQGSATVFCGNGMLQAEELDGASYEWYRGTDLLGSGASLDVNESGTYSLVVSKFGCSAAAEIEVNVLSFPARIALESTASQVCPGETVNLSVTPVSGASYEWFRNGRRVTGATGTSITTDKPGDFEVLVSLSSNCEQTSESIRIERFDVPAAELTRTPSDEIMVETADGSVPADVTWFMNGEEVSAFAGRTSISPGTDYGVYYAILTYETGCETASSSLRYFPETSDVTATENDPELDASLDIFPNPTAGRLTLKREGSVWNENANVSLTDNLGREITQKLWEKGSNELYLDLETLSAGVYVIRISTDSGKIVSRKVIRK